MANNKFHDNRGVGPGDQENLRRLAHRGESSDRTKNVTGSDTTSDLRHEPHHTRESGKTREAQDAGGEAREQPPSAQGGPVKGRG